ncbi:tetratricopeptide repeat protein [Pleurocapsa sp. PCC 7319]|uniref:protein kinase domain-containing protein n=1 Tax=Pleurocapsa sp. PCC 7319 TaxID=118161 RepID=UPI00034A49EC|nr:tetratricopeptide repeat protein [Pleurocapsa sp. PCC 7319]
MSDSDFTIPISQSENSCSESTTEYGYKALKPGDILNHRYYIVKELGSGGFATTYLALDQQSISQDKYAVKQLQPRFNSSSVWASAKERLATEAMVLQWLGKHDQIPNFIGHFEENQQFYLVLEFVEGEEFEQEVHQQVLNEAQAIDFLFDILELLKSVHSQGIIHRDIKPSNLIRRQKDGKMILIDFGAVKEIGTMAFDASKQQVRTQIIGTPGYMAPEQNNGKPVYSSDIYALGKTVIFGMTNRSPMEWEESESGEMIAWNKKIAISEAFLNIINRMTAKNTAERYRSAEDVLCDLRPLEMIGKTIADKYHIVQYLGGTKEIISYVINSLEGESKQKYYLEILEPQSEESLSLSDAANDIMTGLNRLLMIDNGQRIPDVIEYFIDESKIYIVQEYISGKNLLQIIEDQFILSEAEVIDLLIDTAEALNPIHKQKIIHKNIQPSSLVRRCRDHKITLINFGLINEAINFHVDSKIGYIPPEQIAGRATYASDIYALGMTAIHVLTGTSPQNLEKNTRTGEVIWHRKARISPGFAKILDKMICLDQSQRYQSLNKVIKDLKKTKHKSRFRGWYKYLIIPPILIGGVVIGFTQWAQRVAILEFYKGDLKLEANQYQQAIDYYNNGLSKLPNTKGQVRNFEQVWLKKAKAQRQLGNYAAALDTCTTALRFYQSYQLWNCKALTLYSLKRYEPAIAAYDQAIEIAPEYLWVWNNRGEAYNRLGKTELAEVDFQKAIELDSSRSFVPWNNLGKLHYEQKEYQKSIEAYEQALAVKKDYLPALIGLGNAQKAIQLYSQAEESYDRALAINPNYHDAWYGKGSVAEYLRQYPTAKEYYQKAFELKPDWEAVIKALERVDRKLGI